MLWCTPKELEGLLMRNTLVMKVQLKSRFAERRRFLAELIMSAITPGFGHQMGF